MSEEIYPYPTGRNHDCNKPDCWFCEMMGLKEPPKREISKSDQWLIDNWNKMSLVQLGEHLNLHLSTVSKRAFSLGLPYKTRCFTSVNRVNIKNCNIKMYKAELRRERL